MVYMDDILIFSMTLEAHQEAIRGSLEKSSGKINYALKQTNAIHQKRNRILGIINWIWKNQNGSGKG